jgi:hypothetical protein
MEEDHDILSQVFPALAFPIANLVATKDVLLLLLLLLLLFSLAVQPSAGYGLLVHEVS